MTKREKILVSIAPALLIGGVYFYFIARPAMTKLTQAEKTATNLKTKLAGVDPMPELLRTNNDLNTQTTEITKLKANWEQSAVGANRPDRIERLNELLLGSGLVVSDSVDADQSKGVRAIEMPANVNKTMTELLGSSQGRARVITVYGTYPQIQNALDKLSAGKLQVVPLRVTMQPINLRTSLREWTLLIWV